MGEKYVKAVARSAPELVGVVLRFFTRRILINRRSEYSSRPLMKDGVMVMSRAGKNKSRGQPVLTG